MRGRYAIPAEDVDRAILQEFEKRRDLVDSLLKKHSVSPRLVHLPKGEAIPAITELVKNLGVDLLVMGTVCRTGIPGFIIGNTAEQILKAVECSTLP